jgi:hypothetical protein
MRSVTQLATAHLRDVARLFARDAMMLAIVLATVGSCAPGASSVFEAAYDSPVKFREGRTWRYPDFELTYIGRYHVAPPQYRRGWWRSDFKVKSGNSEQTISWSAGTGDIGPAQFTVAGVIFNLDLVWSEKVGKLKDDELVVSKRK